MIAWLRARWPDRLAGRLAVTILAALFATQTISVATLFLARPPPPLLVRAEWLADAAAELATELFARPGGERALFLETRPERAWLDLDWSLERPDLPNGGRDGPYEMLRERLLHRAGGVSPQILVAGRPGGPGPMMLGPPPPRGAPPDMRDMPVMAPFVIAMQGADGSWLAISAAHPGQGLWRVLPFAVWLLSAGLVVAVLSIGAARRLIAPLRELAWAAERVGLDRDAAPVAERGPREIRVIVRAFNRMRERLQRFVDDRTQMLASISHDLRTPLTRLRLRIEMSEDPEVRRGGLSDIAAMETMVAETLSFATHDAHKEAARATDLAVLVAGICDDAVDAGADIRYRGPAHLTYLCQPVGMGRAIANLVGNAVKFGTRARVVVIGRGAEIAILILDRGPGLPKDEIEKVFRPFYRLSGAEPDGPSGAGLGLAVARNIVRAHGGDIVLRNRRSGGLAAIVTLPASSPG